MQERIEFQIIYGKIPTHYHPFKNNPSEFIQHNAFSQTGTDGEIFVCSGPLHVICQVEPVSFTLMYSSMLSSNGLSRGIWEQI